LSLTGAWFSSSSSDESIIAAFRRVAAARIDFRGDADDIVLLVSSDYGASAWRRGVDVCGGGKLGAAETSTKGTGHIASIASGAFISI
jgi:hypothetical protein